MGAPKCSDEELIAVFMAKGAEAVEAKYGVTVPNVYKRRRRLEQKLGIAIPAPSSISIRFRSARSPFLKGCNPALRVQNTIPATTPV